MDKTTLVGSASSLKINSEIVNYYTLRENIQFEYLVVQMEAKV